MSHVRAHIRLTTQGDVMDLIHDLREFSDHVFSIENFSGTVGGNREQMQSHFLVCFTHQAIMVMKCI